MNSSISSSDRAPGRWRGFAATFLASAALLTLALVALAFLLDPYDTGRTPLKLREGVRPQGPRTAAASRARDLAFDAGIFGNSHVQLLSPERLTQATGLRFVSLIAPATGPRETLLVLDWFLRQHRGAPPKAVLVGVDSRWCTADPALPVEKPFPFWLFSRDQGEYLVGLMSFDVVEELVRRIGFLASAAPQRARRDGYWDYEPNYQIQGYDADPALRARLDQSALTDGGNSSGPFPAAERLETLMRTAPAETALILLRPPVYITSLPAPGSAAAQADAACRQAFAGVAQRRPRSALIDWRVDRAETRDPGQFFDHTHYRHGVARLVEADIARALRDLR